jgi:hypothetical protein
VVNEAVGEGGRLDLRGEGQRPVVEHQQPDEPDKEALVVMATAAAAMHRRQVPERERLSGEVTHGPLTRGRCCSSSPAMPAPPLSLALGHPLKTTVRGHRF